MFRLPIWLYRARLGWVFGNRLLMLEHIGRRTGQTRRVVLEVVAHNDPAGPSWTVASGYAQQAAWYRNLRATPRVTIRAGARGYDVVARFLSSEEGGRIMAQYGARHPRMARILSSFMGFELRDGSAEEFRRVGESTPFVRFELDDRD